MVFIGIRNESSNFFQDLSRWCIWKTDLELFAFKISVLFVFLGFLFSFPFCSLFSNFSSLFFALLSYLSYLFRVQHVSWVMSTCDIYVCMSHVYICMSHVNICTSHVYMCVSHVDICMRHIYICMSYVYIDMILSTCAWFLSQCIHDSCLPYACIISSYERIVSTPH